MPVPSLMALFHALILPILINVTYLLILKSLRSKLCAYLLGQAKAAGADTFSIPFSRAGLAEYLNCERSALCREISRMRAEGLIETYKNSFKILDRAALAREYQR